MFDILLLPNYQETGMSEYEFKRIPLTNEPESADRTIVFDVPDSNNVVSVTVNGVSATRLDGNRWSVKQPTGAVFEADVVRNTSVV